MSINTIYKILIIDDDPNIRLLLKTFLTNPRYEIYEAMNVEDGIEISKTYLPHLVFLDINLDETSGFEYLNWKSQIQSLENTSVIMMSTDAFSRNIKLAMALGSVDFIAKPLINRTVLMKTRKALFNRGKQSTAETELRPIEAECLIECSIYADTDQGIVLDSDVKISSSEQIKILAKNQMPLKKVSPCQRRPSGQLRTILQINDETNKNEECHNSTISSEQILERDLELVYVLDDDANFCKLIQAFLEKFNVKTKSFHDPIEMKAALQQNSPSICVIDLSINDINDSYKIIKDISQNHPGISILIATGTEDQNATAHGLEVGANDYILKPVNRDQLFNKLIKIISEKNEEINLENFNTRNEPEQSQICLSTTVIAIDEMGMQFRMKSLIQKGAYVTIRIPDETGEEVQDLNLMITKAKSNYEDEDFCIYGEYLTIKEEEIAQQLASSYQSKEEGYE